MELVHLGASSLGVDNLVGIISFVLEVNLPYLGVVHLGASDAGICAVVVGIYAIVVGICIYCAWYYTTYKSGRYFTYPKKRSLGCTLDVLRSEEQQP